MLCFALHRLLNHNFLFLIWDENGKSLRDLSLFLALVDYRVVTYSALLKIPLQWCTSGEQKEKEKNERKDEVEEHGAVTFDTLVYLLLDMIIGYFVVTVVLPLSLSNFPAIVER